ncbi:hypothetical protein MRX96_037401 [Rhipicephalus microplus]
MRLGSRMRGASAGGEKALERKHHERLRRTSWLPGIWSRKGSACVEPDRDVDALTGSDRLPGNLTSGVSGAATDKTSASRTKQAEAKESEPSTSASFRMITQSAKQCTNLLQSLNLPIYSKPIIRNSAAEGGPAS